MLLHQELSDEIVDAFYSVHKELGYGFLEQVYQNALYFELISRGYQVLAQKKCEVYYHGVKVGDFQADMLVENLIILELKARETIMPEHKAQLINYLKASAIEVGYVLNFGKKAEFERIIYTNDRKVKIAP
jgi:GxxExxY protein